MDFFHHQSPDPVYLENQNVLNIPHIHMAHPQRQFSYTFGSLLENQSYIAGSHVSHARVDDTECELWRVYWRLSDSRLSFPTCCFPLVLVPGNFSCTHQNLVSKSILLHLGHHLHPHTMSVTCNVCKGNTSYTNKRQAIYKSCFITDCLLGLGYT